MHIGELPARMLSLNVANGRTYYHKHNSSSDPCDQEKNLSTGQTCLEYYVQIVA